MSGREGNSEEELVSSKEIWSGSIQDPCRFCLSDMSILFSINKSLIPPVIQVGGNLNPQPKTDQTELS